MSGWPAALPGTRTSLRPSKPRSIAGTPGVKGTVAAPRPLGIAKAPPTACTGSRTPLAVACARATTAAPVGICTNRKPAVTVMLLRPARVGCCQVQPFGCGLGYPVVPNGRGRVIATLLAGSGASLLTRSVTVKTSPGDTVRGATLILTLRLGRCGSATGGMVRRSGAGGGGVSVLGPAAPPEAFAALAVELTPGLGILLKGAISIETITRMLAMRFMRPPVLFRNMAVDTRASMPKIEVWREEGKYLDIVWRAKTRRGMRRMGVLSFRE